VVLFFLDIAAFVVVIVAWFAILFTGSYPRGMFGFVEGHPVEHPGDRLHADPRHRPVSPFRLAPRIRHAGRPAML